VNIPELRRGEVSPLAPALRASATPLSGALPRNAPLRGPRPPGPPINNVTSTGYLLLVAKQGKNG
jgi:hypothetical protein